MHHLQTIYDIDWAGKTALVRVDFNVPFNETSGEIADDTRIKAHIPTIEYLSSKGAKVVLISHLGNKEKSLKLVASRLTELLERPVDFSPECVGEQVQSHIQNLAPTQIMLLENLRQHAGEKTNDEAFAKELATLGDVYVYDAFATCHRKHASTYGVMQFMGQKVLGAVMAEEIKVLDRVLEAPKKPFVVMIGGSKVSSKLGVLKNLAYKADTMLIGGAMANTFLKATGVDVGASLTETDMLNEALLVLQSANKHGCKVVLPSDVIVAEKLAENAATENVGVNDIEANKMALDIGKHTRKVWAEFIQDAHTVLWNGPAGVFEIDCFAEGTLAVAKAVAKTEAYTVMGGGDTIHAASKAGVLNHIDYVSTGGGALLEFLEGKELPALEALGK